MSAQTWRVVLASGEVREVVVRAGHSTLGGVGYFARISPTDTMVFGVDPRGAVLRLAVARYLDVAEILAPGEPTRAELIAQRDAARADASLCADLHNDTVREMREAAARGAEAYLRMTERAEAAWREGAEAMRREIDGAVMSAAAWADYRSQQHASPDDDEDATHAQAHALDTVLAAIRALPLPARPEVSRG